MDIKIISPGCLRVNTECWSKKKIVSFFDFDLNPLLKGHDLMFLPEMISSIKDKRDNYSRVFWFFEQTPALDILEKISTATKTVLDYNECFSTIFTIIEFHEKYPEKEILAEENYFLSCGHQRTLSCESFDIHLSKEKGKWVIGCNTNFQDRINDPFWYHMGAKLFFPIEPVL